MKTLRYKHHVIPLHEWKRRINPKANRRDKDFNALDNVVWLTLDQHIQVHWLLYERNGSEFDRLAARGLSGHIGKEDLRRLVNSFAHIGNTNAKGNRTDEFKQRVSIHNIGNHRALGCKHPPRTKEYKLQKSASLKGIPLGPSPKVSCPHCQIVGGINTMKRWHFDNCKIKA